MKLGVSSYSFARYMKQEQATYFDICQIAKDIGFDAIEFVDLDLEYGTGQTEIALLATDIKAHCDAIGLQVCAYTIGADLLTGSQGNIP